MRMGENVEMNRELADDARRSVPSNLSFYIGHYEWQRQYIRVVIGEFY